MVGFIAGCEEGVIKKKVRPKAYAIPQIEAKWIRDGEPIEFEGESWFPMDSVENFLDSEVYWMGECSGSWDLIFGIFTKSDYDFFHLKNELISKFNKLIVRENGETILDVKQYPKMYLTNTLCAP